MSRPIAVSTAATLGASVVSVAVTLATSVIVARAVEPAGKGAYDLAVATAALLALVMGSGLPSGITFVIAGGLAGRRRIVWLVIAVSMACGVGGWFALDATRRAGLGRLIGPAAGDPSLAGMVAILAATIVAATCLRAVLAGGDRVGVGSWLDAGGRLLVLVAVAAAVVTGSSSPAALLAATAWGGVASVLAYLVAARLIAAGPPTAAVASIWRFARMAYVANILQFLSYRLDVFLLGYFRSLRDVGLYALAVALMQLSWLASGAIASVVFARAAQADEVRRVSAERAALFTRIAMVTGGLGAAALVLAAPFVLEWVYGTQFAPSAIPMAILLPGIVAFSATNVMAGYLAGIGRPDLNAVVSGVGVIPTLVLDVLLIPPFGILGAAVATTVSYSVATIAMAWLFKRATGYGLRVTLVPRLADAYWLRSVVRPL